MDRLIRKKINALESVPPGVDWNKEAGWKKIESARHAGKLKRKYIRGITGLVLTATIIGSWWVIHSEKASSLTACTKLPESPAYKGVQVVLPAVAGCKAMVKEKISGKKMVPEILPPVDPQAPIASADTFLVPADSAVEEASFNDHYIQITGDTSGIYAENEIVHSDYKPEEDASYKGVWTGNLIFDNTANEGKSNAPKLRVRKKPLKRRNKVWW